VRYEVAPAGTVMIRTKVEEYEPQAREVTSKAAEVLKARLCPWPLDVLVANGADPEYDQPACAGAGMISFRQRGY
jgi:hypothetical protein